jgi:transglutaminase-like putative cysteine protease
MLIKIGFDIELLIPFPTAIVFLLKVHPSREHDLIKPEHLRIEPQLGTDEYLDLFGNHCGRVKVEGGSVRFQNEAVVRDSGQPDPVYPDAKQHDVRDLPVDTLNYLLPSRYCEVDSALNDFAWQHFGHISSGWQRVQTITDFVHNHLRFDYQLARATRTALEGFREQVGVCRDFTHLAVTFCRCMNIPARYVTGYLGDIGVPPVPDPMDFSAWFEVYLDNQWHTFDARHNRRRIGRIVIGRGRDAGDVPITMVFGKHLLERFTVVTEEVADS